MFYGIIIRMYNEKGGKHNKPHIHAEFQSEELVIALDGEVLEGEMPKNKMKLLEAWMEIHRDEFAANRELLSAGERFYKIEPLK